MVTISFFRFSGFLDKWWAFTQMGIARLSTKEIKGLRFVKLLGSGGLTGFGSWPNWTVYSLLCVWESQEAQENFFNKNLFFLGFIKRSIAHQNIFLQSISAHGTWDGQQPFETSKHKSDGKIAVITRGKIKLSKLWTFWQFVSPASNDMQGKEGMIFCIGVGELPLIQQATFSIWESTELMTKYAYHSKQHLEVIKKTRELGWYEEELFARFEVLKIEGNWK